MQISATTPISSVSPVDRTAASVQSQSKAHDAAVAAAKAKAAEQETKEPKVFTPAPPLRPNVQDYVDINRTLILLRQVRT